MYVPVNHHGSHQQTKFLLFNYLESLKMRIDLLIPQRFVILKVHRYNCRITACERAIERKKIKYYNSVVFLSSQHI
jgi:hypothetical protein